MSFIGKSVADAGWRRPAHRDERKAWAGDLAAMAGLVAALYGFMLLLYAMR